MSCDTLDRFKIVCWLRGPGWDPYFVRELNRLENAETTFRGERREGSQ